MMMGPEAIFKNHYPKILFMKKRFFLSLLFTVVIAHKNYSQTLYRYNAKQINSKASFEAVLAMKQSREVLNKRCYFDRCKLREDSLLALFKSKKNNFPLSTKWMPSEEHNKLLGFPVNVGTSYIELYKWMLKWSEALRGISIPR
jgi:hypothetical protein